MTQELIDKYLGELSEEQLKEMSYKKFDKEIRRAGKNKTRLRNLTSTIQSMGDGGMLPEKDVKILVDKIKPLM